MRIRTKLDEVIMLQELHSKLAYMGYDDLHLPELNALRRVVAVRLAELIKPEEKEKEKEEADA